MGFFMKAVPALCWGLLLGVAAAIPMEPEYHCEQIRPLSDRAFIGAPGSMELSFFAQLDDDADMLTNVQAVVTGLESLPNGVYVDMIEAAPGSWYDSSLGTWQIPELAPAHAAHFRVILGSHLTAAAGDVVQISVGGCSLSVQLEIGVDLDVDCRVLPARSCRQRVPVQTGPVQSADIEEDEEEEEPNVRRYKITSLQVPHIFNKFGDRNENGLMFVMRDKVPVVKSEIIDVWFDQLINGNSKPHEFSRPLVLRANVGETVVVELENEIADRGVGISLSSDGFEVEQLGMSMGSNRDMLGFVNMAPPGGRAEYRWTPQKPGIYQFKDGNNVDGREIGTSAHGLWGALVVWPAGYTWTGQTDKEADPTDLGTYADIHPPESECGSPESRDVTGGQFPFLNERDHTIQGGFQPCHSQREYVVFMHDEPAVLAGYYPRAHYTCDRPDPPTCRSVSDDIASLNDHYNTENNLGTYTLRYLGEGQAACYDHFTSVYCPPGSEGQPAKFTLCPQESPCRKLDGVFYQNDDGSDVCGVEPSRSEKVRTVGHHGIIGIPISYRSVPNWSQGHYQHLWSTARELYGESAGLQHDRGTEDEEVHHSSWFLGDADTPILRGYIGDPFTIHLLHAGVKETHVLHLHVYQWHNVIEETSSPLIDAIAVSPGYANSFKPVYGVGSRGGNVGDVIYHCHLYPHFAAGMFGYTRGFETRHDGDDWDLYPDNTPIARLEVLPDRARPPKFVPVEIRSSELQSETEHPGFPRFMEHPPGFQPRAPGETANMIPLRGQKSPQVPWVGPRQVSGSLQMCVGRDSQTKCNINCMAVPADDPNWAHEQRLCELVGRPLGAQDPLAQQPSGFSCVTFEEITRTDVEELKFAYKPITDSECVALTADPKPGSLFHVFGLPRAGDHPENRADHLHHVHAIMRDVQLSDMPSPGWHNLMHRFYVRTNDGTEAQVQQQAGSRGDPARRFDPIVLRAPAKTTYVNVLKNDLPWRTKGNAYDKPFPRCTCLTWPDNGDAVPDLTDFTPVRYDPVDLANGKQGCIHGGWQGPGEGGEVGVHVHHVKFDQVVADGASTGWNYLSGPMHDRRLHYRWWADEEFGAFFFHDHPFAHFRQNYGLFGMGIVEPEYSVFLTPDMNHPAITGMHAVVLPHPDAPSGYEFEPFRCWAFFLHDWTPAWVGEPEFSTNDLAFTPSSMHAAKGGMEEEEEGDHEGLNELIPDRAFAKNPGVDDPGVMGINYKSEPLRDRITAFSNNAQWFSSSTWGDPYTDLFHAYSGEKIRFRLLHGSHEESHIFAVTNMRFHEFENDPASDLRHAMHVGVSERFNFRLHDTLVDKDGDRQEFGYHPGDYVYHSTPGNDRWLGMWGIIRILDTENPLSGLPKLPGAVHRPLMKNAAGGYAINRRHHYEVHVTQRQIPYSNEIVDPFGLVYELAKYAGPGTSTANAASVPYGSQVRDEDLEPLIIRAHVGQWVEIKLVNDIDPDAFPGDEPYMMPEYVLENDDYRPSSSVSLQIDGVLCDIANDGGTTIGNNGNRHVAPGRSRVYRYYVDTAGIYHLADSADLRHHKKHGLIGALVVEAADAVVDRYWGNRAWVTEADSQRYFEAITIQRDGMRLYYKEDVAQPFFDFADEHSDVFEFWGCMRCEKDLSGYPNRITSHFPPSGPECDGEVEVEDQGQKGFNYGTNVPRNVEEWYAPHSLDKSKTNIEDYIGPAMARIHMKTPVFELCEKDYFRFMYVGGGVTARSQTVTIPGFAWHSFSWTDKSMYRGEFGATGPEDTKVIELQAGGRGDYVYRSYNLLDGLRQGQWGLIRVNQQEYCPRHKCSSLEDAGKTFTGFSECFTRSFVYKCQKHATLDVVEPVLVKVVDAIQALLPGDITHQYEVTNNGVSHSGDVILFLSGLASLPAGVTVVDVGVSDGTNFHSGTDAWMLGTLAPGETAYMTVTLNLDGTLRDGTTFHTSVGDAAMDPGVLTDMNFDGDMCANNVIAFHPFGHQGLPIPSVAYGVPDEAPHCRRALQLDSELPPVMLGTLAMGNEWMDGTYPRVQDSRLDIMLLVPALAGRDVDGIVFDGTHSIQEKHVNTMPFQDKHLSAADARCNYYGATSPLAGSPSVWLHRALEADVIFDSDSVIETATGTNLKDDVEALLGMGDSSHKRDECHAAVVRGSLPMDHLLGEAGCGFLRCASVPPPPSGSGGRRRLVARALDEEPQVPEVPDVPLGDRTWETEPGRWNDAPEEERLCKYLGSDGSSPQVPGETRTQQGEILFDFGQDFGGVQRAWRYSNSFTVFYADRLPESFRNQVAANRWADVTFHVAVYLPRTLSATSDVRTYAAVRIISALTHVSYVTVDNVLAIDFGTDFQWPMTVDREWVPFTEWSTAGIQHPDGFFLDKVETKFSSAGALLNGNVDYWFSTEVAFTAASSQGEALPEGEDCALDHATLDSNCLQYWQATITFRPERYALFCFLMSPDREALGQYSAYQLPNGPVVDLSGLNPPDRDLATLDGVLAFRYRLQCRQDGQQVRGPVGTETCPLNLDKTVNKGDFVWPSEDEVSRNSADTHFDTSNDASLPSRYGGIKFGVKMADLCNKFVATTTSSVSIRQSTYAEEGACAVPGFPGGTGGCVDSSTWAGDHVKTAFLPRQSIHVRVDITAHDVPLSRVTLFKACVGVSGFASKNPTGKECSACGAGPLNDVGTCALTFDRDDYNAGRDWDADSDCKSPGEGGSGVTCTGLDSGFSYDANQDDRKGWLTYRYAIWAGSRSGHRGLGSNVFSTSAIELAGGSPDDAFADDSRSFELASVVEIWYDDGAPAQTDIHNLKDGETLASAHPDTTSVGARVRRMTVKHLHRRLAAAPVQSMGSRSIAGLTTSASPATQTSGTTGTSTSVTAAAGTNTGTSSSGASTTVGSTSAASSGSGSTAAVAFIVSGGVAAAAVIVGVVAAVAILRRSRSTAGTRGSSVAVPKGGKAAAGSAAAMSQNPMAATTGDSDEDDDLALASSRKPKSCWDDGQIMPTSSPAVRAPAAGEEDAGFW